MGLMVKRETPDSIHFFDIREGQGDGLSWWVSIAIEGVDRSHMDWILPARLCRTATLKALQIASDLGVRPVGGSDEFATNDALAIDEIGLRPHVRVEEVGRGLMGIAHSDQVNMAIADEAGILIWVFVDADGEDGEIGIIVVQLEQGRKLFDARSTLTPPEVQQHYFAAIVRQMDGSKAIRNIEIGSRPTGLCGMGTAVTAGNEGQSHEEMKG